MKRCNLISLALLVLICFTAVSVSAGENAYLFSYFINNGEDGFHLAMSRDGLNWSALNHDSSYITPVIGNSQLMRDPCITKGLDGLFHMVWTVSWNDRLVGHASSTDLINWSEQQEIPVMMHEETARNCWAPEIFYDDHFGQYIIYWSTTIPERFTETAASSETDYNHRIYCTTTSDFVNFTPTRLFLDPGFNCIDGTINKRGDSDYVMFFKDETLNPPAKNIKITYSSSPHGPWSAASAPITGGYWAEGPTALFVDGVWTVYFDKYRKHAFGAVQSRDLEHWQDISDRISFPEAIHHGTAFAVDNAVLDTLLAYDRDPVLRQEKAPYNFRKATYKTVGDSSLALHVFEPKQHRNGEKCPAVIFFFGGGWHGGTPSQFYPHCKYLASRGIVAISAEYRVKSRNGTSPSECVKDGKSAIRWLRKHADEFGVDPEKIVAGGGSAGGHVAASTAIVPGVEEEGENLGVSSCPDALVLFNPVLDTTLERWKKLVGGDGKFLSPLHHIRKDLPPAILFNGTADTTTPVDIAESFEQRMLAAGNVCTLMKSEGVKHGFFNLGRHDNVPFRDTVKAMDGFLTELGYLPGKKASD